MSGANAVHIEIVHSAIEGWIPQSGLSSSATEIKHILWCMIYWIYTLKRKTHVQSQTTQKIIQIVVIKWYPFLNAMLQLFDHCISIT